MAVGNSLNITDHGNVIFDGISAFHAPNRVLSLSDDFIPNTNSMGLLQWSLLSSTAQTDSISTNPGLLELFDDVTGGLFLANINLGFCFSLGGGTIYQNFVISLSGLSSLGNRYTFYSGLGDNLLGALPDNGIYFSYSDNVNSGNWVLNCSSSTVVTSVNTAIPAVTGFVNLGIIINAAGTSISFYINGVQVGTAITTNIPSIAINPFITQIRSSGALPGSLIDLFYLTNVLNIAR